MFRTIREINETIRMANAIAAAGGEGPRWSLFLKNRSFIAQVIATLFAVAGIFGIILPFDAADVIEIVAAIGFLAAQGWALVERIRGKTRVVWSKDQAEKAITEADALTAALRKAGA